MFAGGVRYCFSLLCFFLFAPVCVALPTLSETELSHAKRAEETLAARLWLNDLKRAQRITYAILKSGAPYCTKLRKFSIGIPPLALDSVPLHLRTGVAETLNLRTNQHQVWFVERFSPVGQSGGWQTGDVVLSQREREGFAHPFAWFFERIDTGGVFNNSLDVKIQRANKPLDLKIIPQMICGLGVQLLASQEFVLTIKGSEFLISTGLLQEVSDDELAFLLGRLLAYYVLRDGAVDFSFPNFAKAESVEHAIMADYIALYVTAQAYFDVKSLDELRLSALQKTFDGPRFFGGTHVSSTVRQVMLARTLSELKVKLARGDVLALDRQRLPPRLLPDLQFMTRYESGQTDVDDPSARLHYVNEVPFLSGSGRVGYQRFLANPIRPRVFVIGQNRHTESYWWEAKFGRDALSLAIRACEKNLKDSCYVYAMDDRVVWNPQTNGYTRYVGDAAKAMRLRRSPEGSGYARVEDLLALPVSRQSLAVYHGFLEKSLPRSLVIMQSGLMQYFLGSTALDDSLAFCERQEESCWLYAVDDVVVWQVDKKRRISRRDQLPFASDESLFFENQ